MQEHWIYLQPCFNKIQNLLFKKKKKKKPTETMLDNLITKTLSHHPNWNEYAQQNLDIAAILGDISNVPSPSITNHRVFVTHHLKTVFVYIQFWLWVRTKSLQLWCPSDTMLIPTKRPDIFKWLLMKSEWKEIDSWIHWGLTSGSF